MVVVVSIIVFVVGGVVYIIVSVVVGVVVHLVVVVIDVADTRNLSLKSGQNTVSDK